MGKNSDHPVVSILKQALIIVSSKSCPKELIGKLRSALSIKHSKPTPTKVSITESISALSWDLSDCG